jgi:hypothetical protein
MQQQVDALFADPRTTTVANNKNLSFGRNAKPISRTVGKPCCVTLRGAPNEHRSWTRFKPSTGRESGAVPSLLGLILALTCYNEFGGVKPKQSKNQYLNNVLYLIGMAIYLLFSTDNDGMFSPDHSLWDVVRESYRAFTLVHPVSSSSAHIIMALSHFASYWFLLAALRSRSLRSMLVWQLLYELVAAPMDEWAHFNLSTDVADEELSKVFCMRRAFQSTVGHYCADEVIRRYVLPPFFVYGYLLPQYLLFLLYGGTTVVGG